MPIPVVPPRPRRRGRVLLAAPLVLLAPPLAAAQEAVPLPPVVATAAGGGSLTAPSPEAEAARLRLVPGNVTLVPAEAFADRAATTLRDVLEFAPGVFAQPKWGEDSRLSIRGSGLARNFHLRGVRLLQDGVPINQADGSGDFQELDPLSFRAVEVRRGANAFGLGASTLGGALLVTTATARDAPGTLLSAEAGSYDFRRLHAATGGIAAGGALDARAAGTLLWQDGFRLHSDGEARRFQGNLGWRWSPDVETRVFYNYNAVEQRIPGAVTRARGLSDPRAAAAVNLALDYRRDVESSRVGTRTVLRLGPDTTLDLGGGFVHRELDHPIFQVIDQRNQDANGFARLTTEGAVAGLRSRLELGGNLAVGATEALRYQSLAGQRGRLTASSLDRARTGDVSLQNTLWVRPDLALVAGASAAQSYRASRDRFLSDGDQSGSGSWRHLDPRLGVLWEAAAGVQAFANLSWSTETPTLSDLTPLARQGFSALGAQRARTVEAGVRGRRGPFGFELAAYRADLRGEIQLFDQGNGATLARNAGRTVHQGVEAALDWTLLRDAVAPGDGLTWRQAYTLSDFRFAGDPVFGDNGLPGAPRHLYRGELRYRHPAGLYAAPVLEWVPRGIQVDNADTLRTNPYATLGLRAGWDLGGGASLFVEGRNLGDKRYLSSASVVPVATAAATLFEPGFGRSVFAGLRLRL